MPRANGQDDANDPHRLAAAGTPAIPHASRDAVDRRQPRRPILIGTSGVVGQAATGWCHRHVHRRQVRGDPCPKVSHGRGCFSLRLLISSVDEFVYMTENGYTKDEILKGERIILQTLDFTVSSYCSPYSWVRRISKADDYDIQTRTLSKFLMEVTLLDHRFLRCRPSMIAALGMYLARKMLGGDWVSWHWPCGVYLSNANPRTKHSSSIPTLPNRNLSKAPCCYATDWSKKTLNRCTSTRSMPTRSFCAHRHLLVIGHRTTPPRRGVS
jgi:hypothetical protein